VTPQREHVFKFLAHFNWPWTPIQLVFFLDQTYFGN